MTLVTVVTPTYRRGQSLLRTARSVVAQTHAPIEHIVVGDRCDMLPALADDLRAINRGIVLLHLPDWRSAMARYTSARIARARNAGVVASSGEYVCQLDSDNTFDPEHVESLLAAARAAPSQAGATCGRKLLFPDGTPYDLPYHPWAPNLDVAAAIWRDYADKGVYRKDSPCALERISIRGQFFGVDAGEIMLKRDVHQRYLFPTSFTAGQIEGGVGEDELLCLRLYGDAVVLGHSERCTLNFYLGGAFTAAMADALAAMRREPRA